MPCFKLTALNYYHPQCPSGHLLMVVSLHSLHLSLFLQKWYLDQATADHTHETKTKSNGQICAGKHGLAYLGNVSYNHWIYVSSH